MIKLQVILNPKKVLMILTKSLFTMHLSHDKGQLDLKDDENENQAEGSNSGERVAKRP